MPCPSAYAWSSCASLAVMREAPSGHACGVRRVADSCGAQNPPFLVDMRAGRPAAVLAVMRGST
ncbi:hypothetical protein HYPGJ_31429 [Hyphomicrobium sp. GJ21]|nr:hypothetical protein HYPGJ_31429 [Hyphomicrobium sp. GJ21]